MQAWLVNQTGKLSRNTIGLLPAHAPANPQIIRTRKYLPNEGNRSIQVTIQIHF